MTRAESSSVPIASFSSSVVGGDAHLGVVALIGEHDLVTVPAFAASLSQAIASEGNVVVDLRDVTFMDASTIGVIVGARNLLALQSRELTVRSPSVCALRVLDACGLAELLNPSTSEAAAGATPVTGAAGALGTWVAVAAIERTHQREDAMPGTNGSTHDPLEIAAAGARRREVETEATADRGAP